MSPTFEFEFYLLRIDGETRFKPLYRSFWDAHAAGVRHLQHGHTVELRRFHRGRSEWHPFDGHPPPAPPTPFDSVRALIVSIGTAIRAVYARCLDVADVLKTLPRVVPPDRATRLPR